MGKSDSITSRRKILFVITKDSYRTNTLSFLYHINNKCNFTLERLADESGNPNVWITHPDGSSLQQVTDLRGISEYPTWSPDGKRIAFHCTLGRKLSTGTGDFEICVVNANGTGLAQITDSAGENKLPAWSTDGKQIAFQSNRAGWPTLPDFVPPGYDPGQFGDIRNL